MRILITGSLGTVGAGLKKELSSRGHSVFGIDLHHSPNQMGFSINSDIKQPTYARCDIGKYRQLARVFSEAGPFDIVYNCAAEFGRWNGEDYYENLWTTNAIGTKNIIRLQESLGFRLIHFSSSEVYGDWPDVMAEDVMENYEVKQLNDYAMSKWVNEMQIRNSISQYGTKTVVVRLFNTYGPGEYYSPYRSVNVRFLYCGLKGYPWTVFKGHFRTSTYLADTVSTLSNISENFISGETYNIGGMDYHSIEELSDYVVRITGADPSLVQLKESELLTTKIKKVDVSKAIKHLNHKNTVSLENGLLNTYNWLKSVYS